MDQEQPRALLYHYTRKERAIENILKDMTLRMGSMKGTNDPREIDPWFFGLAVDTEPQEMDRDEYHRINRAINAGMKDACRIVCLTEEQSEAGSRLAGYEHDRMWAQYAGNHTGVCIALDQDKLFAKMQFHFQNRPGQLLKGPINYAPEDQSPFSGHSLRTIRELGEKEYAKLNPR